MGKSVFSFCVRSYAPARMAFITHNNNGVLCSVYFSCVGILGLAVVKKTPVGAHYGLNDWIAQRATAAVLLIAVAVLAAALLTCRPADYESWRAFVMTGWVRGLLLLSILSLVWHAYIGARDIFMDYIKNTPLRLFKTVGMFVYLAACVVWAAIILL